MFRQVIADLRRLIGRRLSEAIGTGGTEKLGGTGAVGRWPPVLWLGVHPVDRVHPPTGGSIGGERLEIDAVDISFDGFHEQVEAAAVGRIEVTAVFVEVYFHVAEGRRISPGSPTQLPDEGVENHGGIVGRMRVVEHPVFAAGHSQRRDGLFAIFFVPKVQRVRLG